MVKTKTLWQCSECLTTAYRWSGSCIHCGSWNSLQEVSEVSSKIKESSKAPLALSQIKASIDERFSTKLDSLDRLIGGGIVLGSLILIGGEPGVGKSTLLLKVAGNLASQGKKVLYVCVEESLSQISIRARRMGINGENLLLFNEMDFSKVAWQIEAIKPDLVIVDSIQVLYKEEIPSSIGSVAQIKELTSGFMKLAKELNIAHILVGHITKTGDLAGPKVLEHMVDTVLYFESSKDHPYRLLRSQKNRFGPTDEIALFQMEKEGLIEVKSPSKIFLGEQKQNVAGSSISCCLEGSSTFLLEVQALASNTFYPQPLRRAVGINPNRLSLLLAVLEKKVGVKLVGSDVFVSLTGGLNVQDPAMDLAICLAVCSSILGKPLPKEMVVLGEVGLTGEVRSVVHINRRLKEAIHLGYKSAIIPKSAIKDISKEIADSFEAIGVQTVEEALKKINFFYQ